MIKLNEFRPISRLEIPNAEKLTPKFPIIDVHMHLGRTVSDINPFPGSKPRPKVEPEEVYESVNKFNIRHVVNLDGNTDGRLDLYIEKYIRRWPGRFSVFANIDFTKLEEPGFDKYFDNHIKTYIEKGVTGIKLFKSVGLVIKKKNGQYLMPDEDLLRPVWETAAKYNIPVLYHIADPVAFFDKVIDYTNERFVELDEHPSWVYGTRDCPGFKQLLDCQENMLRKNPDTRFVIPHVGGHAENLKNVGRMLDTYPNMYVDTAERIAELGRQPYSSRDFLIKYQDRVLYGTDLIPNAANVSGNYRFFESKDEHFYYNSWDEHNQGNWMIYGVYLPDEVLRKIYYENALKVAPGIKKMLNM